MVLNDTTLPWTQLVVVLTVLVVTLSVPATVTGALGDGDPASANAAPSTEMAGPASVAAKSIPDAGASSKRTNHSQRTRHSRSTPTSVDGEDPPRPHEEPSPAVPFRAGPVVPAPGLAQSLETRSEGPTWVLAQFNGTIDYDTLYGYQYHRAEIVATDPYLEAHYARIPAENLSEVAALSFVRSVTPIQANWKVSPNLQQTLVQSQDPVTVTVHSFEPISHPRLNRTDPLFYRGTLTRKEINRLKRTETVQWIEPWSPGTVQLSEAGPVVGDWMAHQTGVDGSGVGVAIIDTGINASHPHFDEVTVHGVKDYECLRSKPLHDPNGHGTHVAGTVAGSGNANGERIEGIAPNADLYASKILNSGGSIDDCHAGLKTIFSDAYDAGARVLSNSWGRERSKGSYGTTAKRADTWTRNHRDAVVVAAIGNWPDETYMVEPALAKNVIGVGAVYDGANNSSAVGDGDFLVPDELHPYNNFSYTGNTKPDVNAPGVYTTGPIPGGEYEGLAGTSMSTPVVSATAALYKDLHGSTATGNEIKAALISTTHPVANPNDYPSGHGGSVDILNALYDNSYESSSVHFSGSVAEGDTNGHTGSQFYVPSNTKKVVITLSWADCAGTETTTDWLKNDLDMYAGPAGDPYEPYKYHVFSEHPNDTVETIVLNESTLQGERGTEWRVNVDGWEVPCDSPQNYDGFFRVVTADPSLEVSTPEKVNIAPSENASIPVDVTGTGSPVSGIYTNVSSPSDVKPRDPSTYRIVGTLSDGYSRSKTYNFSATEYGSHTVTVDIKSINSPTIRKDVTIYVEDVHPPTAVANLHSTTHTTDTWSRENGIEVAWDAATDSDSGVAGYSYVWDQSPTTTPDNATEVGSSTTSTSQSVSDGQWYFHVRAVDGDGNGGPVNHIGPFQIDTQVPNPTFVYSPSEPKVDEVITFDASGSTDDRSGIDLYEWNVDADASPDATGETMTHAFSTAGEHSVSLYVTDNAGNIERITKTLTVTSPNTPPNASFSVSPSNPNVNETVSFDGSASTDPDGSITGYEWDFDGDGATDATGETVDHTFATSGTHSVTLTVTDDSGATDQVTNPVSVASVSLADTIDTNDDGVIGDVEILTAINLWRTQEPVPGTGGETIDDVEILELINLWRYQTPI